MKLRFLIVGLGSMGKRRIRNLFANNERDIVGFDIRPDRNQETRAKYGVKVISSMNEISPNDFDALIISTAPEAHGEYIRFALKHSKHFFVEHPTFDHGYSEIFAALNSNITKAPSCTMRFYSPIIKIKEILHKGRIGKILAFQYHMGQYLPDWHPWEDYRNVYFSKKETGACREMFPFELIWLNWVMGSDVAEISGAVAKVSDLDMSADDIFTANVKYRNGILGNVIIDVISRKPFRTLRVLGSTGVLEWERSDLKIKIFGIDSQKNEMIPMSKGHAEAGYINEEEMYNEEIKAFLGDMAGKAKYPHTFKENFYLLKTLYALEESSRTGRKITLKHYDQKKD